VSTNECCSVQTHEDWLGWNWFSVYVSAATSPFQKAWFYACLDSRRRHALVRCMWLRRTEDGARRTRNSFLHADGWAVQGIATDITDFSVLGKGDNYVS
jgi:hypothetical protein